MKKKSKKKRNVSVDIQVIVRQHASKLKKIGEFGTIIVTIVTMILGLLQMRDWIRDNKKLEVVIQDEISLSYLTQNDERYSNMYPLFQNYIDDDKEYFWSDSCATQLFVTNHYDAEIVISEIVLKVSNIKKDNSAKLFFIGGNSLEKNQLFIKIVNDGWSDVKNLEVTAVDESNQLKSYFSEDELKFDVPIVKAGSFVEVPFLKYTDLIKECEGDMNFDVKFEVVCEGNALSDVVSAYQFKIQDDNMYSYGAGGDSTFVYGIQVDTSREIYTWSEKISECVEGKQTLVLPICFFPDRSCTMEFEIVLKIEHDGKSYYISTPLTEANFTVSSYWKYCADLKFYNEENQLIHSETIVSYPEIDATMYKFLE